DGDPATAATPKISRASPLRPELAGAKLAPPSWLTKTTPKLAPAATTPAALAGKARLWTGDVTPAVSVHVEPPSRLRASPFAPANRPWGARGSIATIPRKGKGPSTGSQLAPPSMLRQTSPRPFVVTWFTPTKTRSASVG